MAQRKPSRAKLAEVDKREELKARFPSAGVRVFRAVRAALDEHPETAHGYKTADIKRLVNGAFTSNATTRLLKTPPESVGIDCLRLVLLHLGFDIDVQVIAVSSDELDARIQAVQAHVGR